MLTNTQQKERQTNTQTDTAEYNSRWADGTARQPYCDRLLWQGCWIISLYDISIQKLSEFVLEVCPAYTNESDSGINDWLVKLRSLIDQACFEFIDVSYFGVVNFLPQMLLLYILLNKPYFASLCANKSSESLLQTNNYLQCYVTICNTGVWFNTEVRWHKLCEVEKWKMSAPLISLSSLPSFCQKFSQLVEILCKVLAKITRHSFFRHGVYTWCHVLLRYVGHVECEE